jgi:HEPN domain-containing protein
MSDRPRRPVETPREWLRYAVEDLTVAARALQDDLPAYHTICFLCQSAAEKSLKGYLVGMGWQLQKTHDIVALLGMCADYDLQWANLAADGAILNEYIVTGRYPGDIAAEDIGRSEAEEALESARRIAERARKLTALESVEGPTAGEAG